jgi:hypothetical protein
MQCKILAQIEPDSEQSGHRSKHVFDTISQGHEVIVDCVDVISRPTTSQYMWEILRKALTSAQEPSREYRNSGRDGSRVIPIYASAPSHMAQTRLTLARVRWHLDISI